MRTMLNRLPDNIQDDLLEMALSKTFTDHKLVLWLEEEHKINISKSAMNRYSISAKNQYGDLIKLGFPLKKLILNRHKIDALGVSCVKQMLLSKAEREMAYDAPHNLDHQLR